MEELIDLSNKNTPNTDDSFGITSKGIVKSTQNEALEILDNMYTPSPEGRLHSILKRLIQSGKIYHRQDLYIATARYCKKNFPKYSWSVFQLLDNGKIYEHTQNYGNGERTTEEIEKSLLRRIQLLFEQKNEIYIDYTGGCIHLANQQMGNLILSFQGNTKQEEMPALINGIERCKQHLSSEQRYIEGMYFDTLTGCRSLNFFDKISESKDYSAIAIDLDGFKQINDTYGHDVGDLVLKEAGLFLQSCVRSNEGYVIRPHGDEFYIVIKNCADLEYLCYSITDRLTKGLENKHIQILHDGKIIQIPLRMTFHLSINKEYLTLKECIIQADLGMLNKKTDDGMLERAYKSIINLPEDSQIKFIKLFFERNPKIGKIIIDFLIEQKILSTSQGNNIQDIKKAE